MAYTPTVRQVFGKPGGLRQQLCATKLGTLKRDGVAVLVAVVCVPLSACGDWLHALLCAVALFLSNRLSAPPLNVLDVTLWSRYAVATKKTSNTAGMQSQSRFRVRPASLGDAASLTSLYHQDYLHVHRRMHGEQAKDASIEEWEEALGPIDFSEVLSKPTDEVKVLTCVDDDYGQSPIGYIVYEFRTKGARGKRRQHYCELVNIVVQSKYQGHGAGRLLFEALCKDVPATAPEHADDLRLFVAERNVGPKAWYTRLGFKHAGWQTERLGGVDVRFLRMML
jgi:ribosomal protein S18 acetylase RimI-like enzyme